MITKDEIKAHLQGIPSKWQTKLTDLLYEIATDGSCMDCEDVKACETVTSLSNFTTSGSVVSIVYTDERGISVTRSFDVRQLLSGYFNINPDCLTDTSTWNNMTFSEQLQMLIDSHCDCCSTTTTTTTP